MENHKTSQVLSEVRERADRMVHEHRCEHARMGSDRVDCAKSLARQNAQRVE